MSKYLHLDIPKPCHENWNKMDAARQGKFCNSCQKNVVDFTLMSDSDLVSFFKKNTGHVCGRFAPDQVNTHIPIPTKKIPWLKYFFHVVIPAFLFSYKGISQTNTMKGKVVSVETKNSFILGGIQRICVDSIKPPAESEVVP